MKSYISIIIFLFLIILFYFIFFIFFFFSSRRRHTRCSRDWSSDVCSSDLGVESLPRGSRPPGRLSTPSPQSGSSFGRIQTSGLFVTRGSHRTPSLLFFWSRSPHLTLPQAGHDSFRIPPGNLRTEGVWYENCSI